jgi:predicted restriction endonuclease
VIHPETARRLHCSARVQTVLETTDREALGMGRITRAPSAQMLRQLWYRDAGCVFPGCGTRRFARAHHLVWWSDGGQTDLSNLVLVCQFHHKLVHEYGWRITRAPEGALTWFERDGRRYRAGPAPLKLKF